MIPFISPKEVFPAFSAAPLAVMIYISEAIQNRFQSIGTDIHGKLQNIIYHMVYLTGRFLFRK